jgi:hypothetical protein
VSASLHPFRAIERCKDSCEIVTVFSPIFEGYGNTYVGSVSRTWIITSFSLSMSTYIRLSHTSLSMLSLAITIQPHASRLPSWQLPP